MFLARFEERIRVPLIVSAVLPLIVAPESRTWFALVVLIVTWLVFVADYAVHVWFVPGYSRTRLGLFDLAVVMLTAPWFLLPGAQNGSFVVVLRLARLARVLIVTRGARRLFERLGGVAVVASGVVLVASLVAYEAERSTNPGFATAGDSLWWGVVTLTTVGYGDIVPKTTIGRFAGVTIMITGIAVLGLLAGSLASFFRAQPADAGPGTGDASGGAETAPPALASALRDLVVEVSALRTEVRALSARLPDDRVAASPEAGPEPG